MRRAPTVRVRTGIVLLTVALIGTACSGPDVIDGSGRFVEARSSASRAAATPKVSASRTPTSTAPSQVVSPGLALLRQLRAVATASWCDISDPRTGTSFALPTAVPAQTKIQSGVSQRIYQHVLSKQSAVSVSYVRTVSAAAAQASLGLYPTQLQASFRALGVDDATVSERSSARVDGRPTVSFRFRFTPTTVPQIPPVWLVTAVAHGADIVLAQTIVFPPSTEYDYLRLARKAQQRLVQSLDVAG